MSKKTKIALILLVIAIVAAVAYWYYNKKKAKPAKTVVANVAASVAPETSVVSDISNGLDPDRVTVQMA